MEGVAFPVETLSGAIWALVVKTVAGSTQYQGGLQSPDSTDRAWLKGHLIIAAAASTGSLAYFDASVAWSSLQNLQGSRAREHRMDVWTGLKALLSAEPFLQL